MAVIIGQKCSGLLAASLARVVTVIRKAWRPQLRPVGAMLRQHTRGVEPSGNSEAHAEQRWSERRWRRRRRVGSPGSSMGSWIASRGAGDRRLLLAFIVPTHRLSMVEQDHTPPAERLAAATCAMSMWWTTMTVANLCLLRLCVCARAREGEKLEKDHDTTAMPCLRPSPSEQEATRRDDTAGGQGALHVSPPPPSAHLVFQARNTTSPC